MFADNLLRLRRLLNLTQEALAEKCGLSRQTLSKYETGESLPDIEKCRLLADALDVTLDDLVNYDARTSRLEIPPRGKHAFGMVTIGEKGQIVIPAKARKLFGLAPGDSLLVLGDEEQGLALVKEPDFLRALREGRR